MQVKSIAEAFRPTVQLGFSRERWEVHARGFIWKYSGNIRVVDPNGVFLVGIDIHARHFMAINIHRHGGVVLRDTELSSIDRGSQTGNHQHKAEQSRDCIPKFHFVTLLFFTEKFFYVKT